MPTESAQAALNHLRDGSTFQWYVIPLLAFVVYVYASEIEKKNWSMVFAGLAYWGLDWFNEIWNALVFHFTQYAPVWGTPGRSAYTILIGLNIEICLMFAVAGIVFAKLLPRDRQIKVFGIPNRLFIAISGSVFMVLVEVLLNSIGVLTWEYSWWNAGAPWLIFLIGYFYFFVVSFWIYDMKGLNKKAIVVGIIYAINIVSLVVFGALLRWI
ncbi:MAG: hypothetical protein ONB31_15860 [candidate division KSB1 bacterium]|nr:hypothetical protein [candidate division KSB1 bacterium]MDZ7336114.1 hypothetical protein [candidate division KSB1 bacterium]MDZ7358910.1 hypothetical protein [candidate division KSB1 bacterium]MDZ7399699.1 hypothetical protein [candidate division KSB1 bacterium]